MNQRDAIQDDALYPGHVVREMLEARGQHIPDTAWISTGEAAAILDLTADYVRKRCVVWSEQKYPPVRVRKTTEGVENAHWRLYDRDVFDLARRRGALDETEEVRITLTGDATHDTISHWADVATRNLSGG